MEVPDGATICGHCRQPVDTLGNVGVALKSLAALMFAVWVLYIIGSAYLK